MPKTVLFVGNESRLEAQVNQQFSTLGYSVYALLNREQELNSETAIAEAVQQVLSQAGQIDVFIWGGLYPSTIQFGELTLPEYQAYMRKAVDSAFYFSKACIKWMEKKRFGRMVFLTSVAATLGEADFLYTIASGCLNTLAKSIAREEARRGITANAIAIGRIEGWETTDKEITNRFYDHYYPFRENFTFAQLAQAMLHLITDDTNTINGQIIKLDGGTL